MKRREEEKEKPPPPPLPPATTRRGCVCGGAILRFAVHRMGDNEITHTVVLSRDKREPCADKVSCGRRRADKEGD